MSTRYALELRALEDSTHATRRSPALDALRRALNYDWPEIQKHLIEEAAKKDGHEGDPYEPYWTTNSDGTRTLHGSADGWWLKQFDRKDVLDDVARHRHYEYRSLACGQRDRHAFMTPTAFEIAARLRRLFFR